MPRARGARTTARNGRRGTRIAGACPVFPGRKHETPNAKLFLMPCIIDIDNLTHRFADGTVGLDGVSLRVEEGCFVVIAGANGSGKTTLLRHLNGLLLPHTGTVRVAGYSVSENLVRVRALVGMMFQDADSQIVGETVAEDVAFGPENLKLPRVEVASARGGRHECDRARPPRRTPAPPALRR